MDKYDMTKMRFNRTQKIIEKIREHIVDGKNKAAIDYGCGTGDIGIQLMRDFKNVLMIDSSPEKVNQVKQRLTDLNSPNVEVFCYDIMDDEENWCTPEKLQADYIIISLALHHIKDTETVLKRLYSMLYEGGHLLVVDIDEEDGGFHTQYPDFNGHNGFNHSALVKQVKDAGFSAVLIETFYHDVNVFEEKEYVYSLFILDALK